MSGVAGPSCQDCALTEQDCARTYPCCSACSHFTDDIEMTDTADDRDYELLLELIPTRPSPAGGRRNASQRRRDPFVTLMREERPVNPGPEPGAPFGPTAMWAKAEAQRLLWRLAHNNSTVCGSAFNLCAVSVTVDDMTTTHAPAPGVEQEAG